MIQDLGRRVSLSLLAASLGGVLGACLDARYLQSGSTSSTPPSFGSLLPLEIGLVAPIALLVGVAVGVALVVLDPSRGTSVGDAIRVVRGDPAARGPRAATWFLAIVAAGVWTLSLAHLAKRMFAAGDPPRAAGAILALVAIVLAVVLTLLVARLSRVLAPRLADKPIDPLVGIGAGIALVSAGLAWGIHDGTPSGQGGVLQIFGVLARDELDLRAPGLLLILAISALLGPTLPKRLFAPLALALSLVPLVLTLGAGGTLDRSPALTVAMERSAPLGKIALGLLRRATDRDHDGYSRTFGGGDCNDRDARIYPTAFDEPGNGIDEDCSGSDAPMPVPVTAAISKPKAPAVEARPGGSVLLITVDTLRADLGYAGYARAVSPRLDELASQSVVFDDAVSLASYTGKSVGPLLSGKYPSETHRGWSHFNTFGKEDIMVAERMRAAGLKTLSVQAHWYFERFSGLGRGFDTLDTTAMPNPGAQQDNDTSTTSDKLTDAAIKRFSDPSFTSQKFFAWIHYLDPHADYLHHEGIPDFGRDIRAPYDHEVAFTDREIGRLLDFLSQQPWAEKLSIVLTSDHGEAFLEHKLLRHGFEVWEELVRVPLFVKTPGIVPHHVKARRSAIDVVPTLLDLAGVTPVTGSTPFDFLSGTSLLPDLFPAKDAVEDRRDVLVDMPAGPNNDERRAFYHGDKKLYVTGGYSYQLFDLATDPGEKTDLGETDKEAMADMRARYEAFRANLREVKVKPIPK